MQGSEDGPQNYDMLTDVFNSHWEKKPMGVRVAVSEQLEMDINGVAYLDDCKMLGSEDHGKTALAELTEWYVHGVGAGGGTGGCDCQASEVCCACGTKG